MCFGHFREVTFSTAVKRKRQLDRAVHANKHTSSDRFMVAYGDFMRICFQTYGGFGETARLRASVTQQRRERDPRFIALNHSAIYKRSFGGDPRFR